MVLLPLRALSVALASALVFGLASLAVAPAAHADSHHLRAQGGAGDHLPGPQYRTLILKQFPSSTPLLHGRTIENHLRKMDRLAAKPGSRATVGEWISKHFGNGVARPGESYPTEIAGVWDPDRGLFHGVHVTSFGEIVALTIDTKHDRYIARKDGGPMIGAARHPSAGTPTASIMRTWGGSSRTGFFVNRLATEANVPNAESIAYEVTLGPGTLRAPRVHALASEQSGLVDQRQDYDVWLDAHTGARLHVTETPRGPALVVKEPGHDPWRGVGARVTGGPAATPRPATTPAP